MKVVREAGVLWSVADLGRLTLRSRCSSLSSTCTFVRPLVSFVRA